MASAARSCEGSLASSACMFPSTSTSLFVQMHARAKSRALRAEGATRAAQKTERYESVSLSSYASQSLSVCLNRRVYAVIAPAASPVDNADGVSDTSVSVASDAVLSSSLSCPTPFPFPLHSGVTQVEDETVAMCGVAAAKRRVLPGAKSLGASSHVFI